MSSGLFKNVIYKMSLEIIYFIYMYRKNLALNDLQWLICHKIKLNQPMTKLFNNDKLKVIKIKLKNDHVNFKVIVSDPITSEVLMVTGTKRNSSERDVYLANLWSWVSWLADPSVHGWHDEIVTTEYIAVEQVESIQSELLLIFSFTFGFLQSFTRSSIKT